MAPNGALFEGAMTQNVFPLRSKRGGARPGAGRKPGPNAKTLGAGRFVYVVHEVESPGICKVGLANHPIKRLQAHQVSNWRPVKLAAAFTFANSMEAFLIERTAHGLLAGLHVSGEWFRVDTAGAIAAIRQAAASCGFAIAAFDPSRDLQK